MEGTTLRASLSSLEQSLASRSKQPPARVNPIFCVLQFLLFSLGHALKTQSAWQGLFTSPNSCLDFEHCLELRSAFRV